MSRSSRSLAAIAATAAMFALFERRREGSAGELLKIWRGPEDHLPAFVRPVA